MWHNLIKMFERTLVLNTRHICAKNIIMKTYFNYGSLKQRSLVCSAIVNNRDTRHAEPPEPGHIDFDADYIVPYKTEYETPDTPGQLEDALRTKFYLTDADVMLIMNDEMVSKTCRQKSLMNTLEILYAEGVTKNQLIEYPWLITWDANNLTEKIKLLKTLNGCHDLNDFVPFIRLKTPRLRRLVASLNRESSLIPYENRIYFIAEKLKVPVSTVSKYMAKRLFVLEMPLGMFKTNLEHMINYKVESMSILKDLWGFRYAPTAVEHRLKRAILAKKGKIMPWMVRCPEPILQKSLQLSLDELKVLGDKTTVAEYVGERLGFSPEEAQAIMNRHPQVNVVRVTKIKEVLDYLLNEAKFTRYEIAQVPRILCHSLKTTKERIEELKKYGCRPSTLVIICRSKREYDKFLRQWINSHKPDKNTCQQESQDQTS